MVWRLRVGFSCGHHGHMAGYEGGRADVMSVSQARAQRMPFHQRVERKLPQLVLKAAPTRSNALNPPYYCAEF